jgi:hypothetical protein
MTTPLYIRLARRFAAVENCKNTGNTEWEQKHLDVIDRLVKEYMPSGSGIDNGTMIDWVRSGAERLVFNTSFHHMNDVGMYDGWTEHTVIVKPSLMDGIDITIGGRNRNDIKDYLHDVFYHALKQQIAEET